MPDPYVVDVHGRARRFKLAARLAGAALAFRHIIGKRAAVSLANRALRLARFDYRVGNGKWKPADGWTPPRITLTKEEPCSL